MRAQHRFAQPDFFLYSRTNYTGWLEHEPSRIHIPAGARLGNIVVEADHLSKAFGDKLLIDDLSFSLPRGGIVGVIGPNGAGKTTLFKMIMGQEKPDKGAMRIGESVELAYADQSRDALDPNKNVWQEISDGEPLLMVGKRELKSRAYVSSFNFQGADRLAGLFGYISLSKCPA